MVGHNDSRQKNYIQNQCVVYIDGWMDRDVLI